MTKTRNNIDKKMSYKNKKTIKDEIKDLVTSKPVQLELPLDNPNEKENVIPFPYKPGSPILDWYKTNKDKFQRVASVEELGPFLTQFYSEKELLNMNDKAIELFLINFFLIIFKFNFIYFFNKISQFSGFFVQIA
ncbi:MAG: hypothetical protein ISQ17_03825 [Pelagibacteraceae bacterium]|nr:hypothetical protein [Pelagibacteraceae bacterium]